MASLYDYPATPSRLVPDGLQARADWELPPATPPPSRVQSNSPSPYAPWSYEGYYEPHDPRDCVHARLLCDKRFADLQALMAEWERCQCRCGQSTWNRTKSFFGSLKKRALSLRSRRKPHDCHDMERGLEAEWPSDSHPSSTAGELPEDSQLAELEPNQAFISELDSRSLAATHPNSLPDPAAAMNLDPPPPSHYTDGFGDSKATHAARSGMAYCPQAATHPPMHVPRAHELGAPMPSSSSHAAAWYSAPLTARASSAVVSPLSPSTRSSSGRHSLVSPQSSFSSVPPLLFNGAATVAAPGNPMFAPHTTSSPVEYDQDDDMAPWDRQPFSSHHNSWDSAATLAELPGGSADSLLGSALWLQEPFGRQLAELEGGIPLSNRSMLPPPQAFGEVQSREPVELAAGFNPQPGPVTGMWCMPQMAGRDQQPMMPSTSPEISKPYLPAQPSPTRPGPRPLICRTLSYDSTASTLDVPTLNDIQIEELPQTSSISELPSQQKPATSKPSPLKRRKLEQEPTCCVACGFHPSPTGRKRKLEKHSQTDGHRRKTGQPLTETNKFPCLHCASTFNRRDNMREHAKNVHGVQQSGTRARGRRRQARREADL